MSAPDAEDTIPQAARDAVAKKTRATSAILYTQPVLDAAATLLADLWTTGQRHGVQPDKLDVAFTCLDAMKPRWYTGIPRTVDEAQALLRVLVEEFAALSVHDTTFNTESGLVLLPRWPTTPTWGYDHPADPPAPQLAVTATIGEMDGGWDLALNMRHSRAVTVAAPCDRAGAAAVARLAIDVNKGMWHNPFRWT